MSLAIIALRYLESYYEQTECCLAEIADQFPIYWAHRNKPGIGSLSAAFNQAFKLLPATIDHVWFITDITFSPEVPYMLSNALARLQTSDNVGAIQPVYASDHTQLNPDGTGCEVFTPYVEFTAPMVTTAAYREVGGLDERFHYWLQDLVFSKRLRDMGCKMVAHHGVQIQHTYHRSDGVKEEVTQKRYRLREYRAPVEEGIARREFGDNWRDVLWCR